LEEEHTPTLSPGIYPEKNALVAGTHGDWKVLDTTLWPPEPLKKWNSNLYQQSSTFITPHHL
jgi:hypothetical protein